MEAPLRLFCCYARLDQPFLYELKKHLIPLQREGLIDIRSDIDVDPGMDWEQTIHNYLEQAQIILLLVSPDFIASKYCYDIEMDKALTRHQQGTANVIPVIIRPCFWQNLPFSKLQTLPENAKPVSSWQNSDEAYTNVTAGIRTIVQKSLFDNRVCTIPPIANTHVQKQPVVLPQQHISTSLGVISPPLPLSLISPLPYHNLPQPDYVTFVGRQKELDWVIRRLSTERAWQMVITGIGGVGKSTLALAIAHYYREHYNALSSENRFEAIIWTSAKEEVLTIMGRKQSALAGLVSRTLEDIYTTIAQTLKREDITRAISSEEQNRLVQKALSSQRTLLIVDNIESIDDERVKTFLRNLPVPAKCIITSREWVDVADMLRLTGLPLEEAEYLITEEATAREVEVSKAEQKQLFQYTSGLPLPIKLSIARMGSGETFDQVSRWLENAKGDLPDYCVKGQIDTARQRNLNAWKLLLTCSRFDREAGASREALGFVADLPSTDRDDGLTLLQRLSLLHQMKNGRFRMLPMVQGYAGVELTRADFGELLTERWLDWLLAFTQRYSISLDFHIEKTPIVHSEYPNLLNATRWCHEHKQWKMLLQLAEGTWFYPFLVGLFNELKEILEAAVEAARALNDERGEGRFFIQLGRLCWKQGQYEKALVEYLKKAEEIALQYKNDADLGQIYHIRSAVLSEQGHLLEAEQVIGNTLEIGERLNDLELKFYASYRLSKFEAKKRHFSKGLKWVDQGETWSKELGWSRGLAWIMYRRGDILIQQGNAMAAEPFLIQSLTMASSWNERHLIAQTKYYLALVYSDTHRLQLARQMAQEAYDLCDRLGMTVELVQAEKLLQTLPEVK